jgi:hypothetical protein
MIVGGRFSFNGGENFIGEHFPHLLAEVEQVISAIDAQKYKTKLCEEKNHKHKGQLIYSPRELNGAFKEEFHKLGGWTPERVLCGYVTTYYTPNYKPAPFGQGAFREMDFIKENLGVEVQLGKYAFMVYNVCAKMTIFSKLKGITAGIEIIPMYAFAEWMSSGISYFEQIVWDLEQRGVSNIDIPVLIMGIDAVYHSSDSS